MSGASTCAPYCIGLPTRLKLCRMQVRAVNSAQQLLFALIVCMTLLSAHTSMQGMCYTANYQDRLCKRDCHVGTPHAVELQSDICDSDISSLQDFQTQQVVSSTVAFSNWQQYSQAQSFVRYYKNLLSLCPFIYDIAAAVQQLAPNISAQAPCG